MISRDTDNSNSKVKVNPILGTPATPVPDYAKGLGERVRRFDWSSTPLGPLETWPTCLRTAVGICMNSRIPMFVWWGPELINIYNDAYIPVLGKRHPEAFGKPAREIWSDIWPVIGDEVEGVIRRGEPVIKERVQLILERNGYPEETYFTYSHSPIPDDHGGIGGLFQVCTDETQQVMAERDRTRIDAHRQLALDAARLGWWHYDPITKVASWDDRFKQIFGVAGYQQPNEEILTRLYPDDLPRIRAAAEAALDPVNPQPYATEYRITMDDGSIRWIEAHGSATFDGDGASRHAVSFVGTVADITERRRADEALRFSENRFRELADTMPQIVWSASSDGQLDYYNRRWFEFIGVPASTSLEQVAWNQYVHPEDLPKVYNTWTVALKSGDPYHIEFRVRGASGVYGWFLVRADPVRDAQGNIVRWYGTCTDIEDRKRSESRHQFLLELDEAVRPLTDPAEITATSARLLGEYLESDRCAYADVEADQDTFNLTGDYNRGVPSIVGRYRFTDFGAEALKLMREDLPYMVEDVDTHQPPLGDLTYYRQTLIQAVICVPLHKAGRFVAAMAVHQRIPRKWTPEEILLVRRVASRCWESIERSRVQRTLLEARDSAEAANRAKDKFLAVLSHELRTPLSPVVMTIPAIEIDPELPVKFRDDLAMIRRNIALEVKLIDDLLDLSRVTTGKLRLQMQPVHVHELLRHALQTSESEMAGKRLQISEQFDARNDQLVADPTRLQQVFWNLLRNALKFTPDGGEVYLRTWDEDGHLCVEVRDTGIGIPAEVLPRVFDAFEQGETRTTRQFGGLGLGLAIAKAVVEMHGGVITATSGGKDQGATFTVRLVGTAQRTTETPESAPDADAQRSSQRARVLLVEDHPDTAHALSTLLEMSGYDVKTGNSVAAALELAAAHQFDVMVSDIGLPDATGYDLMRQIRDRHGIKGIALTGYGMEDDMRRSRDAGFVDHVVKPIDLAQLQIVLRRVLDGTAKP